MMKIFNKRESNNYTVIKSSDSIKVREIMRLILEYSLHDGCTEVIIKSYMVALLDELLRIYKDTFNTQLIEELTPDIAQILQYIQANIRNVTLQDISDNFKQTYPE